MSHYRNLSDVSVIRLGLWATGRKCPLWFQPFLGHKSHDSSRWPPTQEGICSGHTLCSPQHPHSPWLPCPWPPQNPHSLAMTDLFSIKSWISLPFSLTTPDMFAVSQTCPYPFTFSCLCICCFLCQYAIPCLPGNPWLEDRSLHKKAPSLKLSLIQHSKQNESPSLHCALPIPVYPWPPSLKLWHPPISQPLSLLLSTVLLSIWHALTCLWFGFPARI